MTWFITTLFSTVIFGIGTFLLKLGSHRKYTEQSMLFGLYLTGSLIFLIVLFMTHALQFNTSILLFSVLIGLSSYYGNYFLIKAFDLGPTYLTVPLLNLNVLLIVFLSAYFFHEKISFLQYIGILGMLLGASLLGCNFKKTLIKSKMWLVFVILGILSLFIREGSLKLAYEKELNNDVTLFYGYALATFFSLFSIRNKPLVNSLHKGAFFLGGAVGVCSAFGMGLLAHAITLGPASVIIPIFSTRNIITLLLVVLFLKEKIFRYQWIAIFFIIAGTACTI